MAEQVRCQHSEPPSSSLTISAVSWRTACYFLMVVAGARVPLSTYRLQFHRGFTFRDARGIVDYLHALGITDCYASSYLKAVPGSPHGYDVADPTRLNPEIGTERRLLGLDRRAARARHGPRPGPGAEPHGDREIGEPVVARRARERAELALRALLRHRMASGEGRARRQDADPDPRRSVRRRARASGTAARLSRRRLLRPLLRPDAADRARHLRRRSSSRRSMRWLERPRRRPTPTSCRAS